MAPENVLAHGYNYSVDWWGLGVLMYVLLTGRQPFSTPKTDDPMVRGSDVPLKGRHHNACLKPCCRPRHQLLTQPPLLVAPAVTCLALDACAHPPLAFAANLPALTRHLPHAYATSSHPSPPPSPQVVMRRIVDESYQIKYPPYLSPQAKDLIARLLERKPAKRLGMLNGRALDIKSHKWWVASCTVQMPGKRACVWWGVCFYHIYHTLQVRSVHAPPTRLTGCMVPRHHCDRHHGRHG